MRPFLFAILLTSGCAVATPQADAPVDATANASTTLSIEGMTCSSCEVSIRVAASRLDGVASVEVDYDTGTAVVLYDRARITPEAIAQVITDLGYLATVSDVPASAPSNTGG